MRHTGRRWKAWPGRGPYPEKTRIINQAMKYIRGIQLPDNPSKQSFQGSKALPFARLARATFRLDPLAAVVALVDPPPVAKRVHWPSSRSIYSVFLCENRLRIGSLITANFAEIFGQSRVLLRRDWPSTRPTATPEAENWGFKN